MERTMPTVQPAFIIHATVNPNLSTAEATQNFQNIIQSKKNGDLVYEFFSEHEAVRNPKSNSITQLRKDIGRTDQVYADYQDTSGTIHEKTNVRKNILEDKQLDGDGLLQKYLIADHPERLEKIQGLCQDIGNSAIIALSLNFGLEVDSAPGELQYGTLKGKDIQHLVKLNDSAYRSDFESIQYFSTGPMGFLGRNEEGKIVELDDRVVQKIKDGKVEPDGSMIINGIKLLPLLKTNVSATLSFDEKNTPSVVLEYDFVGYTPKLHCDKFKEISSNKVEGLECTIHENELTPENKSLQGRLSSISKRFKSDSTPVESTTPLIVPTIDNFPGVDNEKINQSLKTVISLAEHLHLHKSHTELNEFMRSNNKTPAKEMQLYQDFFNAWELKYADSKLEQKENIEFIHEWRETIMVTCSSEDIRNTLLKEMKQEFSNIQSHSAFLNELKDLKLSKVTEDELSLFVNSKINDTTKEKVIYEKIFSALESKHAKNSDIVKFVSDWHKLILPEHPMPEEDRLGLLKNMVHGVKQKREEAEAISAPRRLSFGNPFKQDNSSGANSRSRSPTPPSSPRGKE